jgi:hypothetical protein
VFSSLGSRHLAASINQLLLDVGKMSIMRALSIIGAGFVPGVCQALVNPDRILESQFNALGHSAIRSVIYVCARLGRGFGVTHRRLARVAH